jgi:SAM-dependent methyltransferase
LDVSVNLLRIAKSRWHNAVLVRADMRFLPFKPKTFADVISMDTSFGYLPSEQDDLQSLNELRAAMVSGGIFIVDVFNREHLMKRFKVYSQPEWKDYPSFLLLQERTVDVDGQKLRDIWTVRDRADGQIRVFEHIARLYELKRLQKLLEKACFKTNSIYGDYEGQSFSPESSRLILIANAE